MKIVLLSVKPPKSSWFETLCQEYEKKISHFIPFATHFIKPIKAPRSQSHEKKKDESLRLEEQIQNDDFVILCDESGESWDSKSFSHHLQRGLNTGKRRILFIIGGAYGVEKSLVQRADLKWSLSPMTLNHLIAHAVAFEQIYRALTIIKGTPYHNA